MNFIELIVLFVFTFLALYHFVTGTKVLIINLKKNTGSAIVEYLKQVSISVLILLIGFYLIPLVSIILRWLNGDILEIIKQSL